MRRASKIRIDLPRILILSVFIMLSAGLGKQSYANFTQLTNSDATDHYPRLNNNGQTVWVCSFVDVENLVLRIEVCFFDGNKIHRLTNNDYADSALIGDGNSWASELYGLEINDLGQIVWSAGGGGDDELRGSLPSQEIFFYNGAEVIRLTNDDVDDFRPRLNNNGNIAWHCGDFVCFYDGQETRQFDVTSGADLLTGALPEINDQDHVVWQCGDHICFFDGNSTTELKEFDLAGEILPVNPASLIRMNSSSHFTWVQANSSRLEDGTLVEKTHVLLFDGSNISRINDDTSQPDILLFATEPAEINDKGQILWRGKRNDMSDLFLSTNGSVTQITSDDPGETAIKLNNNGYVVWNCGDQICLYDGMTVSKVSGTEEKSAYADLNDRNEIAYSSIDRKENKQHEIWVSPSVASSTPEGQVGQDQNLKPEDLIDADESLDKARDEASPSKAGFNGLFLVLLGLILFTRNTILRKRQRHC